MGRLRRIRIVVRQLEARQDEQSILAPGALGLVLDSSEIRLVVERMNLPLLARRMVGDREDVEPAPAVEIDDLAEPEAPSLQVV